MNQADSLLVILAGAEAVVILALLWALLAGKPAASNFNANVATEVISLRATVRPTLLPTRCPSYYPYLPSARCP